MEFPSYRKYTGRSTWFHIQDAHHFTEIQQVGSRYLISSLKAVQYPEMVLIQDMLACHEGRWEVIDAAEYEAVLAKATA